MKTIEERAKEYASKKADISLSPIYNEALASIYEEAYIAGAKEQRCIDNEYFRQKIKKAILWLKCRSEFPFSDSMLDSFGQFMEDKK